MGRPVSQSYTRAAVRWRRREVQGMRRGARRARSRLVYETTMHARGKSVQMRRLPSAPFTK